MSAASRSTRIRSLRDAGTRPPFPNVGPGRAGGMAETAQRPRLAVILTEYGATSHGECYCTKFLEGKQFDDHYEPPRCDVVSMHLMEIAKNDIGVAMAAKHGVPMYHSVASALCRGGDE